MKEYATKLDPVTKSQIEIKLFRKVENVPELRKKIMNGQLKCAIIKPTLIIHPFQIVIAANKALVAAVQNRLVTRSIFSEILFNLSISKNVSKSLPLFGIDDQHSDILVATIKKKDSDENLDIYNVINGEETDFEELENITDLKLIKKIYSISEQEEKNSNLLEIIVNKIVTKEC